MKLYIANIDYGVNDDQLREFLESYGTVDSCKIITDRETGKSRGFGFAELPTKDAKKAISEGNGQDFHGRNLVIREAKKV